MEKTTITRNFQITIPREIREKLHLKQGEHLRMQVQEDHIIVERMEENVWDTHDFLPANFPEILDKLRTDETEKYKRLGIL
jgi:AbrB family looped-hinge helix DNA binding protein